MVLAAGINTIDKTKSDQLFDAYVDFQADATIKQKNFINFQAYIKSKNIGFTQAQIGDIFEDLWNPDKKQEIINTLEPKAEEIKEEAIQAITKDTEEHNRKATEDKKQVNQENKMKMEDLMKLLQDKPENAKENAKEIVDQAKIRLGKTIGRYVNKIKELKGANTEEINKLKDELRKEKESYEKAKKDFFGEIGNNFKDFSKEELKKLPIRFLRYKQREWLFNKPDWFNSISSIRRRKTINTLAKKMNAIWKDYTKGINFVMGFHKERFWRYTDIRINSTLHKLGANIWLQMNPQQFHERFNRGRNEITETLDNPNAGELSLDEKTKVNAIKNRINYYGAMYAKERANARVGPFINAEKNATEKEKIIQMTPPSNFANVA